MALVSPMLADGSIDWKSLSSLVDWHVDSGTDGIVAVGTTGESPTLDFTEHRRFIAKVIELVDGRIQVIAGTGANSTVEAIELTRNACDDGANACLSVVPYYNKPPQEGLARHFETVADNSDKPIIVYNVPGRTITDLADDTLARLSEHPMIIGVKDATGEIDRLRNQKSMIDREGFSYLSGDDSSSLDYILSGGHGVISVTANIAPRMFGEMVSKARAGDEPGAREILEAISAFNSMQAVEANPIPVKWALHKAGKIGSGIRLPLVELSSNHHEAVGESIKGLS